MTSLACRVWLFGLLYLLGNSPSNTQGADTNYGVRDYCEGETFQAHCAENEVIIMQKAEYGRMRIGRCVKVDMGYIGCSVNALDVADDRCSGKQECDVSIPDPLFEKKEPCLELKSYLEAGYSCLKVMPVDVDECRRSRVLRVTAQSGYIASALSYSTWCGTSDTPWLIEARPGQRINLTLLDFSVYSPGGGSAYGEYNGIEVCQKYAVVREEIPERSTILCGGRAREHTYTSNSNVVRIGVEARSGSRHHFVIKFEVKGCPDPEITSNAWFKRENNEITLGCKDTDESWHLTCLGTKWVGEIGNCSRGDRPVSSHIAGRQGLIPRKIVIVTVCGIAFVVGVLILMIGIFFFKKYKQRPPDVEQTVTSTPKAAAVKMDVTEDEALYPRAVCERGDKTETLKDRRRTDCPHSQPGTPMYQKGKVKNVYTHIWEMPLPVPEDSG